MIEINVLHLENMNSLSSTIKVLSLALFAIFIVAGLALSSRSHAGFDDPIPSYSIDPSLNGLNIAYFVKQDKVKATLYLVNHEKYAVICDAEYTSGPEKKRAHDQTIPTEKAVSFAFDYGRRASEIHLAIVCIKPDGSKP